MKLHRIVLLGAFVASSFLVSSCQIAHVWVETEGAIRVPVKELRSIHATTLSGNIRSVGTRAALQEVTIRYTVRAGGENEEDARDCMRNVEILHDVDESGELRLHWRFAKPKRKTWETKIDYLIDQPSATPTYAECHNGDVSFEGVTADCRAKTHNGSIRVEGTEGAVHAVSHNGNVTVRGAKAIEARSHNGRIRVDSHASRIALATHNGGITSELHATPVGGTIVTHNGPISLRVRGKGAVEVEATGDNANIRVGDGFEDVHNEKQLAWAKRGIGGEKIRITTKNGIVNIRGD